MEVVTPFPGPQMTVVLGEVRYELAPAHRGIWHEYANLFPMMAGADADSLREDIRANGVREPVVFFEGAVLDGRNRFMAARDCGIAYPAADYIGTDPLAYVISMNLKRRHLTESQRATVAAKVANIKPGDFAGNQHVPAANLQTPQVSQAEAAQMLNVSERSVASAVSQEAKERIKAMWVEPRSGGYIARELGLTRNTVIGVVSRAGLKRGKVRVPEAAKPAPAPSHRPTRPPRGQNTDSRAVFLKGMAARRGGGDPRLQRLRGLLLVPTTPPVVFDPHADAWAPLPGSKPVPLEALPAGACKWPIGNPALFCAEPVGAQGGLLPRPYPALHVGGSVAREGSMSATIARTPSGGHVRLDLIRPRTPPPPEAPPPAPEPYSWAPRLAEPERPTPRDALRRLICEVAAKHDLPTDVMMGSSRRQPVVSARREAIWRVKMELGYSVDHVGEIFNRDGSVIARVLRSYRRGRR